MDGKTQNEVDRGPVGHEKGKNHSKRETGKVIPVSRDESSPHSFDCRMALAKTVYLCISVPLTESYSIEYV